jgi:NAD(P)-dependent dehydrogenase (short-subunit alcohol dehydrogenase family)
MKEAATELAGKVAIVIGGWGAIGRAILDAFDQAGAHAISLDFLDPGGRNAETGR